LTFSSEFKNDNNVTEINSGNIKVQKTYQIATETFDIKEIMNLEKNNFEMHFSSKGSESFEMIPIGKETNMNLKSKWRDANFFGTYLPYNPDKLKTDGFDAHWKILEMNRPFAQQFNYIPDLNDYAFGVNFMIAIDDYQQNERSAKYGYLVIALTFLLFFLIQTLSKINIHPFQYLLIGLALVIFYTLLLAISEHSNFSLAYLIAGISTIILIGLFSKSIMKSWKFPVFITLSLAALYGFIYVIIQLEELALLVGSIGLFAILASVMYVSRKIEWN
jgi:inner membrane protein